MKLFIFFLGICFSVKSTGQIDTSSYFKSQRQFVGEGINPFYEYLVGNDTIYFSNSFSSGIRDSRTNVIIDAQPKRKLDAVEDSLLKTHENLNFISFYPNISFELYKALPLIPNLKGFTYNQHDCFGCSHEKIMEFNKLESNVFNAEHFLESKQNQKKYREKITAAIELTNKESIFEMYPNLKYLEYSPISEVGDHMIIISNKKDEKYKKNVESGFCNVPSSYLNFSNPLSLETLVYREAKCDVSIELPRLPNLKRLVLIDSHLPLIWNNFKSDSTVQEVNFIRVRLPGNFKKVRFVKVKKLVLNNVSGDLDNLKFDKMFQNLEEVKVVHFDINHKSRFRTSSLANSSNLKKIELKILGGKLHKVKLPKKSRELTTLHIENSGLYSIPKHLEEFKKLDTLILEVKYLDYSILKSKLMSLPNLQFVRVLSSEIQEYDSKYTNYDAFRMNQPLYKSKLEKEILSLHPNKDLNIIIESKERVQLLLDSKRYNQWVPYSIN